MGGSRFSILGVRLEPPASTQARDSFYKCVLDLGLDYKPKAPVPTQCQSLRKDFEKSCLTSWVSGATVASSGLWQRKGIGCDLPCKHGSIVHVPCMRHADGIMYPGTASMH